MCDTCNHSKVKNDRSENTFQSFIDSPEVRVYTPEKRSELTVDLDEDALSDEILPSMIAAAQTHVAARKDAIERALKATS